MRLASSCSSISHLPTTYTVEITYSTVAHGGHDSVSSRIESPLDEPFFTTGDTNHRRRSSGHDGNIELFACQRCYPTRETGLCTHVIVIPVRDQAVLGVNECPVEFAVVEDGLR